MFDDTITESDYKTIQESLQSSNNIRRKSKLNMDEINSCLVAHVLAEILRQRKEGKIPTIAELLDIAAGIKEELALSNKGFALKTYAGIMSREMRIRDMLKNKKEKDPVEFE